MFLDPFVFLAKKTKERLSTALLENWNEFWKDEEVRILFFNLI